jgi:pilus assembly protein CpaB
MRRQTLIALAGAIVLGLFAVYLANTFLVATERRNEASELTRVAVAAVPMAYGTEITADKVRFAKYPRSSLPAGSFRNAGQLFPKGEKRVALMPIGVNEPILADKISGAGRNASIAALLPDGMRAATVRINDVSGVAGFIQPRDSVDVLITRQFANDGQQITDVLLQDVKVLAMGQRTQGDDGRAALARSSTLQVDPVGAQKLALAQEVGSLSLVLRKPGQEQDTGYVETVSLSDLRYNRYGRPAPTGQSSMTAAPRRAPVVRAAAPRRPQAPRAVPPSIPPAPRGDNVEVVRGVQGKSYEVGDYER